MRSDSFERGGQPRSVPDHDREGYEHMIRAHRALMAGRAPTGEHVRGQASGPQTPHEPHRLIDHVAAAIVHVLNEPRVARHEFEQGHAVKGAVETVAAASDLALAGSAARGLAGGPIKAGGSHAWRATRRWMAKTGRAVKGQHVHHALIPNGGWGKLMPDVIKNQPWNLKAMESPLHHIRTHGRSLKFDLPRFNAFERYWYATPTWWKAANASFAAHVSEPLAHGMSEVGHFMTDHLPAHDHRASQAPPRR